MTNFIRFDFIKWELAVLAFLVLVSLLIWRNKGIKSALLFFVVTLVLLGVAFVTKCMVYIALDDPSEAIRLGVTWGPTVEFVLVLFFSVVLGIRRGFRKSALLMLHAVCAAAVCLGLFFFFVKSSKFDAWLLKVVNMILGDGGLQNLLGVEAQCSTVRQVLAEWIPAQFGYGTEISIILRENGAYLMTIVDMAYRIVFAIVCYLLYLFLVFVLYIVYHIAYSERKYKRRKNALFSQNKTDSSYKKHPIAGGVVGLARGLAAGLISLSFLGGVLFMAAGTGKGKSDEYSFGNDNLDFAYSTYRSIEQYGEHGIFKWLNAMKNADESPYYLFAMDLVFSGELNDDVSGIHEHIKFREEIGAYTRFARETMQLLFKYGGDELSAAIRGEGQKNVKDVAMQIMQQSGFQAEFEGLIDGFESQTYVINFALNAVGSLIGHLDETSFASSVSENTRNMLKLLFRPGYLSSAIPDERAMIESGKTETQPYIGLSQVLNKSDAKVLYRIVIDALASDSEEKKDTLQTVKSLLPQLGQLTILDTDRSKEFDPVLGRLYCYLANVYLSDGESGGVSYAEVKDADVSWVQELSSLVSVAENGIELYETVRSGEGDMFRKVLTLFDEENEQYAHNIALYDSTCAAVTGSKLIGAVLNTDRLQQKMRELLSSFGENMYLPERITYHDTRVDGATEHGELYQFLYGLRLLADKSNRELLDTAMSGGGLGVSELLDMLSRATTNKDAQGNSLADYMLDSVVLRSLISTLMVEKAGDALCVPAAALETDENRNPVQLIRREPLRELFDSFTSPHIKDVIVSFIDGTANAGDLLADREILDLLDKGNPILEGTVAKALLRVLDENEFAVVPRALEDAENWVTTQTPGELRKIVNAVRVSGLDFNALLNAGTDSDALVDMIFGMDKEALSAVIDSEVLYYTVSEFVLGGDLSVGDGFSLIIPNSVKRIVKNDSVDMLVERDELRAIFSQVADLGLSSESSPTDILRQFIRNKQLLQDSVIVCASAADFLIRSDMGDTLKIPARYIEAGTPEKLADFDAANIWRRELIDLVDAMDYVFGLGSDDDFEMTQESLEEKLGEVMPTFNEVEETTGKTKLRLCYDSAILRYNVTDQLDRVFSAWNSVAVTDDVIAAAKNADGDYTYEELEALTDAMYVFDLDDKNIMNLKGDTLQDAAKAHFTSLNEPLAQFDDKTGLEVIYPSVILSASLTHEMDKAFKPSVIDPDFREQQKDKIGTIAVYKQKEAAACIDAALALGIDSVEEIGALKFSELAQFALQLDTLYESRLLAGSIMHAIHAARDAEGSVLRDHPAAYEQPTYRGEITVYRKEEVRALIELLAGNSVSGFTIGDTALLRNYIYDDAGKTKSYLLVGSLSDNLLRNNALVVPRAAVSNGCIKPAELAQLLDAFLALNPGGKLDEWQDEYLHVPNAEQAQIVADCAILRATITKSVQTENHGKPLYVSVQEENRHIETDARVQTVGAQLSVKEGEARMITADQLKIMFEILRGYTEEGEEVGAFAMPTVKPDTLMALAENPDLLELYLSCDILRYQVSSSILQLADNELFKLSHPEQHASIVARKKTEKVCNLANGTETTVNAFTATDAQACITDLQTAFAPESFA